MMKSLVVGAALLVGSAGIAFAQAMSAQDFVDQAASGGMFEVQSSELALERSQNADVQAFAETMIADHTENNEALMAIAQEQGLTVPEEIAGPPADHMQAVEAAEGDDFDSVYVEHQVAAHQATVELFQTYAESGDVEPLVAYAESSLPTLQQHLEQAQALAGQ
jgi:putative membrane protein